jgi:hypothetical protein
MAVSEHDRAFMERIGEIKRSLHDSERSAHLSLPFGERLERSWALFLAYRSRLGDEPGEDPTPFYERARALGLYQP